MLPCISNSLLGRRFEKKTDFYTLWFKCLFFWKHRFVASGNRQKAAAVFLEANGASVLTSAGGL
jgi:hypothetical protein